MPNAQFHISKAERNEEFYQSCELDSSKFNEWAIVLLFYISMHYVDAVLSQDTTLSQELRDPENHFTRNRAISQCPGLSPIASMYLNLYHRSKDARYRIIHFPNGYLSRLKTISFEPVQGYLRKYLGLP